MQYRPQIDNSNGSRVKRMFHTHNIKCPCGVKFKIISRKSNVKRQYCDSCIIIRVANKNRIKYLQTRQLKGSKC